MNTDYKSEIPMKIQIEFAFVSKRVRILAIAILVGIVIIFTAGIITSSVNVYPIEEFYSLIAVIISVVLSILSFPVKRIMLKRVTEKKFMPSYFNASIIPLALCDVGGLFGIVTNLFISVNIIYASACLFISVLFIFLVFPNAKDLGFIDFEKSKVKVV